MSQIPQGPEGKSEVRLERFSCFFFFFLLLFFSFCSSLAQKKNGRVVPASWILNKLVVAGGLPDKVCRCRCGSPREWVILSPCTM